MNRRVGVSTLMRADFLLGNELFSAEADPFLVSGETYFFEAWFYRLVRAKNTRVWRPGFIYVV